jgi:SAM-dependent methyltransferase
MFDGPRRFVDANARFAEFKQGAELYPSRLTEHDALGLWQKPLDWSPGHPSFLGGMTQLLNALQAMGLEPGSTIVEVGSGAGWATEWLAGLTYGVICIEPSEDLIEVAKQRVSGFLAAHRMSFLMNNVTWQATTLEEAAIADKTADAVLFFESFHHIIDESRAAASAHRILKDDGVLCIIGDSNWIPGNPDQEESWKAEMAAFGTLESPFTDKYLTHVLKEAGFAEVRRYHAVNTLVPVERDAEPVRDFVTMHATHNNLFLARKVEAAKTTAAPQESPIEASEPSGAYPGVAPAGLASLFHKGLERLGLIGPYVRWRGRLRPSDIRHSEGA